MTALDSAPPQILTRPARHFAVVGGGFLGMRLAQRLRTEGHAVTLIESAPHLGGMADAWTVGDVSWDRHYHVILLSDLATRGLLTDLGLNPDMKWVETKTGFFTDGKLVSMSNTVEFLKFPPLGLLDKLRLGATIFYASKVKNWQRLEKVPVEAWLRKWSGTRTTEKIWLPLLRAKLGENYQHASAAFLWAIIARMYAARKSGLKKEMFGYCRGGYGRIVAAFEAKLRAVGVTIRTGEAVTAVRKDAAGVRVEFADGETETFSDVIVTAAAPVAAKLCPDLSATEAARLRGLTYQGIVCASVVLSHPLAHYYVTNITDAGVPFTAVIEMTALVDPAEFGGKHLVYLPKYVPPDDPLFEQSDDRIRETFVAALAKMYPAFRPEHVLAFRVSRVRTVLAISTLNFSEQMPDSETSVPGLHLVNSAQIPNGTLNINETLLLADRAADKLLGVPV